MKSVKYQNTQSRECPHCNVIQNGKHEEYVCIKYRQNATSFNMFKDKHQAGQIKEITLLNPTCHLAVETVCMYV